MPVPRVRGVRAPIAADAEPPAVPEASALSSARGARGALALAGLVVLYFLVTGRNDRNEEEDARRYFDEHGHWPDEAPGS